MELARQLGVYVARPDEEAIRGIREVELADILATVFDDRSSLVSKRLEGQQDSVVALEARIKKLKTEVAELESQATRYRVQRHAVLRFKALWQHIEPQISDEPWYRAAIASDEMTNFVDTLYDWVDD